MSTIAIAAPLAAAHWVGHGPGFGIFFFVGIPLFFLLLFGLIFAFAGRRWRHAARAGYGPWGSGPRGAESTLAERFAQGDIDEVEYRARLEVLRANRPGA